MSNRLNDYLEYDSVADWHRARFGRRLLKGLLRSTEARWDPARLELLDSVSWELTQSKVESDDAVLSDYFPAETNIIFRKSVEDIIEALSAPTPSVVQLQILEKIRNYDTSAHEMTTEWIWQAFRSAHSDLDYDQTNKMAQLYISKLYDGLDDQILDEQFRKNLDSSDESRFGPALYIAEQSGQIKSLYTSLFVFDPELQNAPFNKRAFLLGLTTRELTESEMNPILTDLSDILESDDQYEVGYGVYALLATQRLRKLNSDSEFEQYQRTYQVARNLVVRDDSVLREFEPESIEFKIYTQLLRIVMNHDVGGQDAYPLIQAALRLHPLAAPYLPFYRIEDRMDLATIDLWVDSFIEFAHSEDARVRSWFITNIPVKTGSVHDELLNQVAASYLNDSDPEIVHEAKSKLNLREADHLIKDD
ncbi:MAG: hypothetical protein AB8C13_10795 [Phycisphaerales bacterium]